MPNERLPKQILYGELQVGKRSHSGEKKRYKDTLKAFLKDFNIPTESWEQIAQDRTKWRDLIRRGADDTKQRESVKPSRNVRSGKPELKYHQQSFLSQTSLVLSATGSLELRLVSSIILEHTNNNISHSWLGFVIASNDRRRRTLIRERRCGLSSVHRRFLIRMVPNCVSHVRHFRCTDWNLCVCMCVCVCVCACVCVRVCACVCRWEGEVISFPVVVEQGLYVHRLICIHVIFHHSFSVITSLF